MNLSKQTPWRNKRYLAWVKSQPCIVTRQPADDPHHVIGWGFGGMGTKAPDWATFPLTRVQHDLLHFNYRSWESENGTQPEVFMRFWRENWDEIQEFFK